MQFSEAGQPVIPKSLFSTSSQTLLLSLILLWLHGCGGGGGSTNDVQTPVQAVSYAGNVNPATVSADNANEMIAGVIGGSGVATVFTAASSGGSRQTSNTVDSAGMKILSVVLGISRQVHDELSDRPGNFKGAGRVDIAAVRIDQTDACDGGKGNIVQSGNISDRGTGSLTLDFRQCEIEGSRFDGRMEITIDDFDVDRFIPLDMTTGIRRLTVQGGGNDISLGGSFRSVVDPVSDTEVLTVNLAFKDNVTRDSSKLENLEITLVYDNILNPLISNYSMTMSGRFYDSVEGYVDVYMDSPWFYYGFNDDYPYFGGSLRITGANEVEIVVSPVSSTTAYVGVDTNGDGLFEHALNKIWIELGVDSTSVNTAPTANAGPDMTADTPLVHLDGSDSTDPDYDLLTYHWAIVQAPDASGTFLENAFTVTPSILINVPGTYEIALVVSDGRESAVDNIVISAPGHVVAPKLRPNIIFFMADDMGLGDVHIYDRTSRIPTPNMDRLAHEGIRFTDAHSPSSVCSPTRYSVLTGRYPYRSILEDRVLRSAYERPLLDASYETVPELMKRAGYHTAAFGKWHLGMSFSNKNGDGPALPAVDTSIFTTRDVDFNRPILDGPVNHGFDYFFGIASSINHGPYTFIENDRVSEIPTHIREETGIRGKNPLREGWISPGWDDTQPGTVIARNALTHLKAHFKEKPDTPFFVYYAATANHAPHIPPDFINMKAIKGVGGNDNGSPDRNDMVVENDVILGELLAFLGDPDDDGDNTDSIVDNTLIILTSDNGADIGQYAPIKGEKGSIYEGGHRVPFIARWPDRIPADSSSDHAISLIDMYATLSELTQTTPARDSAIDSVNILPALLGAAKPDWERGPMLQQATGRADLFSVRDGNWKLIIKNGNPVELYNLATDLKESNNLVENTVRTSNLTTLYKAIRASGISSGVATLTDNPRDSNGDGLSGTDATVLDLNP